MALHSARCTRRTCGIEQWERNAFGVGLRWTLPNGYFGAQYIRALEAECDVSGGGDCAAANDTSAIQFSVGYYHDLSKQSQAFIVGAWLDNDDNGVYGTAGISNPAKFRNVGATILGIGVGLKHVF